MPEPSISRGVFCNRTLNMRSIHAVGFDMDYTLVHYDVERWERRAFEHACNRLRDLGHPVEALRFDAELITRGLVVDLSLGNVVKANRFGYVTRAAHGARLLPHEEQRQAYSGVWVDLAEPRWVFMNTLFSLSEGCLFSHLVDLHDAGELKGVHGYAEVYELVRRALNATHLEGELKAEISAAPEQFVLLDEELPLALLDLKHAGKKLMVITNSEWTFARDMMAYTFDRFLPGSMGWRELFDVVIVQAAKPGFFDGSAPMYAVVDEDEGLLKPCQGLDGSGRAHQGGHARQVEQFLGVGGEEILYVGDHVYADVHVSSRIRRWRTALVLRELEDELEAQQAFAAVQAELEALMADKAALEREQAGLRLSLQRQQQGYAEPDSDPAAAPARMRALREELDALDHRIAPLARAAGQRVNARWGELMRAGNDKSRLARQIERHADIYMSRVSNLLHVTPFAYLRAPRGSLPHD
jgi:HAD superfamily 5'-nucleotidase-like hydrolase